MYSLGSKLLKHTYSIHWFVDISSISLKGNLQIPIRKQLISVFTPKTFGFLFFPFFLSFVLGTVVREGALESESIRV